MKTEKLGQEPLFAYVEKDSPTPFGFMDISHAGMSQRLYLAGMAMQGLLSCGAEYQKISAITARDNGKRPDEWLVFTAISLADELLRQEAE